MSDSERLADMMAKAIASIGDVPNYGITWEQKKALEAAQFAAGVYLARKLDDPIADEQDRENEGWAERVRAEDT